MRTQGDHAVKGEFVVSGNGLFEKGLDSPYLEIIDQKLSGTSGGTFNGQDASPGETAWVTRDLTNTVHNDFATAITLAAAAGDGGDFTLEKGIYYTEISCPAFNVNEHVARLADVTDNPGAQGDTVILGTTEFSADSSGWADAAATSDQTRSFVTGRFTLTSQRKLEVQHLCAITQSDDGLGSDGAFYDVNNVYTIVKMWQLRDYA